MYDICVSLLGIFPSCFGFWIFIWFICGCVLYTFGDFIAAGLFFSNFVRNFRRREMECTTRSNSNFQSPLARVLEHSNHMLARGKETSYRETKLLFLPRGGYSLPPKNEKK